MPKPQFLFVVFVKMSFYLYKMDLFFEFETLTQKQIKLIKQAIACIDRRFINDVNDQEVWDWVRDKMERHKCSFADAAEYCYDDWDFYYLNNII